jgi:hypothetical protein
MSTAAASNATKERKIIQNNMIETQDSTKPVNVKNLIDSSEWSITIVTEAGCSQTHRHHLTRDPIHRVSNRRWQTNLKQLELEEDS